MRIPNFVFDARLYEGDATLVYAGVCEADGKPVVGKLVRGGARNLGAELALLNKLSGPGVVEGLGVFESSEGPTLVQRRFGDGSLAELLRAGPVSLKHVLSIGQQLAEVLGRIHAARVLHRDIKPANVLFDRRTEAVALADFGVAIELPMQVRALAVSDLVGTPAYVAPEQTGRIREQVDARSDLYSVGVTLYQLLTGTLPFASGDLLDLIAAHLSKVPEPPSLRNPAVPAVLSAIVMKLLAKAKEQRYQSARGLAVDLARCLQTLSADGTIPMFELGRSDLLRPRMPKVMGRDRERGEFVATLNAVKEGSPRLVLVSGREGTGRSSFVREVLRAEAAGCLLADGGWTNRDDRPLAGISAALESLAARLLLLDDAHLEALRARVGARVGQVGQVLVDIAPALGDVLGPQPALAELGPVEARSRLRHAFCSFVSALAEEQTFVLSLAEVEHADAASLSLVEALLETGPRALVVLSALDLTSLGALAARPEASSIELGSLSREILIACTRAMLECGDEAASELGNVLYDKSAGNPGMFVSLIEHFLHTGVIERSDGAFTWSLERVRSAKGPGSIGSLAAQRVAELAPPHEQLLCAVVLSDARCDVLALSAMTLTATEATEPLLAALEREGLIEAKQGSYAIAHPAIAEAVRSGVSAEHQATMQGRLGLHLLRTLSPTELGKQAFRVAALLASALDDLTPDERARAAELHAQAAEQASSMMAYDRAAELAERGRVLLGDDAWGMQRALVFRLTIALARALMMQAQHERVQQLLTSLAEHDLSAHELGVVYPSLVDSRCVMMDRRGAVTIGLEGLARLGFQLPAEPTQQEAVAVLIRNEQKFATMTPADHVSLPLATDERAMAAQKIISNLTSPLAMTGQTVLYLLSLETGLEINLVYGHTRYYASYLGAHAFLLHSRIGNFASARKSAEACQAVQAARPAPEIDGRTFLVLYYLVYPWISPWRACTDPLAKAIQFAVEAGDPVFAVMSASGSITLMSLCAEPLDRMAATIEGRMAIFKPDVAAAQNAANMVNIAGKFARGEAVVQADLDRISGVPAAAGTSRNSGMLNLALALLSAGHEAQVRTWLEEVRTTFPQANIGQPHHVTVWLLEGLFAAKDAQGGKAERLADAEQALAQLTKREEQAKSGNLAPVIQLLEAELARARGEQDRALGLYGRAASEARSREFSHLLALAMERRAELADTLGYTDEAALFLREATIAYRRWGHQTKVRELEHAHPTLKTLELSRSAAGRNVTRREHTAVSLSESSTQHLGTAQLGTAHGTVSESLDLATVLKVSQEISTQLSASGVVRAVLLGIAQNAGAERVLLILRTPKGEERVIGEAVGGHYRDIGVPLAQYAALPASVLRLARRTARPLIVSDAKSDPAHASDPFVTATGCRSIAVIPVQQKGAIVGFVLLENQLVSGAFTPQLVSLTQALVTQATISFDNASLYENMEARVKERTAALNARNAEMRLVLDNVDQGLVVSDRAGRLSAEKSAILGRWFSERQPETLAEMFESDPTFGISWEQLVDGFLPLELCVDQLPKQLWRGEQVLELSWQPIANAAGELERMLLVLSDITEALRRREAEREQKEMMAIFERLSQDRSGVIEFVREAASNVRELERAVHGDETDKRLVHTLKGNAGLFGLARLSTLCHEVESALVQEERGLTGEERRTICDAWRAIEARLGRFLNVGAGVVQVARRDYEVALKALLREGSPVAQDLELWKLETLESRFERIGDQAKSLAERLDKAPLRVELEHAGIRLQGDAMAHFWAAFVHVVRNAIDHGLEHADERATLGKGAATCRLDGRVIGSSLVIAFSDDGRGIAWEKVREKARERGLACETHEDLVEALFSDGMSTKESADELSGRGVGMPAVREACLALGGRIEIDSERGHGTTLRFTFPSQLAKVPRERKASLTPSMFPAQA